MSIVLGLQQSKTRSELQSVLHKPNFSINGATRKIQFLSGDRRDSSIFLIQVQPKSGTNTGYELTLLESK